MVTNLLHKMTQTTPTEKKERTLNSTFTIGAVLCSDDTFVVTEASALRFNIYAKISHLCQAKNVLYNNATHSSLAV